jgi:hypothetical protein
MAIGSFGALVKFGEPEQSDTEDATRPGVKTYNGLNKALMVTGAAMVVGGLAMYIDESMESAPAEGQSRLVVGVCPSPISMDRAVAVRLRF